MSTPPSTAQAPDDGFVELNLPAEIEIKTLVDYVGKRLELNILYDEQIANKKLTVKAEGRIPVKSLLGILQSALKVKGLILVDADEPGWKRIVPSAQLPSVAATDTAQAAIDKHGQAVAVTQAFVLKHASAQKVDQILKPFLTTPGGNSVSLVEDGVIIVSDFATNMLKITRLIEWIDRPKPSVVMKFVSIKNLEAGQMAQQLTSLLTARSSLRRGSPGEARDIEIAAQDRTNQIVIIGTDEKVEEVVQIIETLDVPLGLVTEIYNFQYIAPDRVDRLTKELISPVDAKRLYRSAIEKDSNVLVVTTTPEIQTKIAALKSKLDAPLSKNQSPMKFYKLQDISVFEVLDTIKALEGEETGGAAPAPNVNAYDRGLVPPNGSVTPPTQNLVPGPNKMPNAPGQFAPTPPSFRDNTNRDQGGGLQEISPASAGTTGSIFGQARVIADPVTNSIIVVAEPHVQQEYEELIRKLDRRRPQVLIEIKIVTLDTTDNFTLGVEISTPVPALSSTTRNFVFSSFGLSQVNPINGALQIIPGIGFNGAMVDPGTANSVIKALASHRRARVVSAPKVLVNDNATGTVESVTEVPFTSVNASQTVSTTSFAGFADAGTTIVVTPHISEGNYIQLAFKATLNSFLAAPSATSGIPPPRQTDSVESQVAVPDGYTVIVGGLNRTNYTKTVDGIPFLEQIPIIKYAFTNRNRTSSCQALFVFIRPIVLREDQFRDLKFLSECNLHSAHLPQDMPKSDPVVIP